MGPSLRSGRQTHQGKKFGDDLCRQSFFLRFSFESQVVTGGFDFQQLSLCGDHLDRLFEFFYGAEGVACAVHE